MVGWLVGWLGLLSLIGVLKEPVSNQQIVLGTVVESNWLNGRADNGQRKVKKGSGKSSLQYILFHNDW